MVPKATKKRESNYRRGLGISRVFNSGISGVYKKCLLKVGI